MSKNILSNIDICLAQLNFTVGDLAGNFAKIVDLVKQNQADMIVFSELALTGYPPEDLLLIPDFIAKAQEYLDKIIALSAKVEATLVVGSPYLKDGLLYNALFLIADGKILEIITKKNLPNYGVFDEKRYFVSGEGPRVVSFKDKKIKFFICEDLWQEKEISKDEVDLIISINASPYELGKKAARLKIAKKIAEQQQVPLIYLNQVGAQDGVVFDGNSFILNKDEVSYLPAHIEKIAINGERQVVDSQYEEIYNSLILGLRDYVHKNNFQQVVLGLSGGIDSAFCAVLACDALGSDKVKLVKLPSKYTSSLSHDDADYFIKKSKCQAHIISISELADLVSSKMEQIFAGLAPDLTEENIQSRLRGILLMSLSNKFSYLLLTTGNKSEYATGYATLYGDMCGGYAPIKDVYKTDLYKLSHYRNKNIPALSIFPELEVFNDSVLMKEPTAELREEQKDSDSLPEYEILDAILKRLIEERESVAKICEQGFKLEDVDKVAALLKRSEYKRFQAIIGTKINKNSFTKDWRMPLTNGYNF